MAQKVIILSFVQMSFTHVSRLTFERYRFIAVQLYGVNDIVHAKMIDGTLQRR